VSISTTSIYITVTVTVQHTSSISRTCRTAVVHYERFAKRGSVLRGLGFDGDALVASPGYLGAMGDGAFKAMPAARPSAW